MGSAEGLVSPRKGRDFDLTGFAKNYVAILPKNLAGKGRDRRRAKSSQWSSRERVDEGSEIIGRIEIRMPT
jgi:hypothetical protein